MKEKQKKKKRPGSKRKKNILKYKFYFKKRNKVKEINEIIKFGSEIKGI